MSPSPWLRKPLWVVTEQENNVNVNRHLTLFDLVSVGVGGTIGSGIFVLAGYIAHNHAGPATCLSYAISGFASCCSGICYSELAGRLPASGSTYVYAYVALGELAAVLSAACLTLEYGASGAAVARTWGDKMVIYLHEDLGFEKAKAVLDPGFGLNPMAFLISVGSVMLLANGVKESKYVTNIFTMLKVGLVVFMVVGGLWYLDTDNLKPFMPFGTSGVLRGATSSFFGYLGYDEVCVIAGESLNPQRDMPRAVLLTLACVTTLYIIASLALVGMENYNSIDETSGFPSAFRSNGVEWAAQFAAAGEVVTLPVVVLISLMAQPRLFYAMSQDALLPSIFSQTDPRGNLRNGTLITGSVMAVIAGCVPFSYLDDLISAGILVAFCVTNSSLVILRCEPPPRLPNLLIQSLGVYNLLCFQTCLLLCHGGSKFMTGASSIANFVCACVIVLCCPRTDTFGGALFTLDNNQAEPYFESPLVPFIPLLGMWINWYLVAQLEWTGLLMLMAYLGVATLCYFFFCGKRNRPWRPINYQGIGADDDFEDEGVMMQSLSQHSEASAVVDEVDSVLSGQSDKLDELEDMLDKLDEMQKQQLFQLSFNEDSKSGPKIQKLS